MYPLVFWNLDDQVVIWAINVLIQLTIIAAFALFVAASLQRMSAARYWVLCSSLLLALCTPIMALVVQASGRSFFSVTFVDEQPASAITDPAIADVTNLNTKATDSGVEATIISTRASAHTFVASGKLSPGPSVAKSRKASEPSTTSQFKSLVRDWAPAVALVWFLGTTFLLGRMSVGSWRLVAIVRTARPAPENLIANALFEANVTLGAARAPAIVVSSRVTSPIAAGLWRPCVVLPEGLLHQLAPEELRGILVHEIAHVLRRDQVTVLLQNLAAAAFWPHPLVRLMNRQLARAREEVCDNHVLAGTDAASYSRTLLKLAELIRLPDFLPGSVGLLMSRWKLEFRIAGILDRRRNRMTRLTTFGKSLVVAMSLIMGVLAASGTITVAKAHIRNVGDDRDRFATAEQKAASAKRPLVTAAEPVGRRKTGQRIDTPAETASMWPAILRGMVQSASGKPISAAHVRLDLQKIHEFPIGRWDELLATQTMVTDESGEYRFNTTKFPKLVPRPYLITVSCTALGFADSKRWVWYGRDNASINEHFCDVRMFPGKVIRGRCVDPHGRPVAGAFVKVASDYDSDQPSTSWAWDPRVTNGEGEYEISVPRNSSRPVELWISHSDWAPQHIAVVAGRDDLADIRLQAGAVIAGFVRYADGKPVVGTVVVARSTEDGDLDPVTFPSQLAVQTDALGRYQLPPLLGTYEVFLSQAAKTDVRSTEQFVLASMPPPQITPATVSVNGQDTETLHFRAASNSTAALVQRQRLVSDSSEALLDE